MKKLLILQLTALLLITGILGGMFVFTDVYNEVHERIVSVLCLSCLKLQPRTSLDFTFVTANEQPHPLFIQENLTNGPLFIEYSADVCNACDVMMPVIQTYLNMSYNKTDFVTKTVTIQETNITFIYINIDHISTELRKTIQIYDKANISGLPMFTFVTLGYDNGFVKPAYTSIYGEQPIELISSLVSDMIELYRHNQAGYISHH